MRPLAWIAVALMAIVWLAMPAGEAAAIAVQRIPELLQAPIAGSTRSLAEVLIDADRSAPAMEAAPVKIALSGVRLVIPGEGSSDLTIHARARRAFVAGLRAAAQVRGVALELEGERRPAEGGWNVLLTLRDGQLTGAVRHGTSPPTAAAIAAPPSNRLALLPALVAIALVLVWPRPLVALLTGVAVGAGLLHDKLPQQTDSDWNGYPGQFVRFLFEELNSSGDWKPIATLFVLLATWAVTARNGGLGGWTAWLSARATNARRAQLVAWLAALCLFLEAPQKNAMLGWGLRTLVVRTRVSAEKFAWLLDSTGTAVLGLCLLSPLTAYAFQFAAAQRGDGVGAGELWLATLPWRGFCWMTLGMGFLVVQSGRDFGPMLAAERRSREGLGSSAPTARRVFAAPEPDPRTAHHALHALAPLLTYAFALLAQTLRSRGPDFDLTDLDHWLEWGASAGASDAHWIAALAALLVALALSTLGGSERGVPAACYHGLRAALRPALLLFCSWALAVVSGRLGAAEVLCASLGTSVAAQTLPAALFLLALVGGFAFGSAWALLPLLLSLASGLCAEFGQDFAGGVVQLQVLATAAVLEGALAGALLSPLSYSSLSASIGAGGDHREHVRTQSPYVLWTALCALLLGFLPAGLYGIGPWTALLLGTLAQLAVFGWFSRRSERLAA